MSSSIKLDWIDYLYKEKVEKRLNAETLQYDSLCFVVTKLCFAMHQILKINNLL